MSPLILLAALAAFGGALALYLGLERAGRAGVPLALLRATAWAGVAALLVDPGCRAGRVPPTVLLDGSLSMRDVRDDARWRAAEDSARRLAQGGPVVLFGATPVAWHEGAVPSAPATRLLPALRDALSRGGPVVIVTDGEVDDASALPTDALRDSRIVVLPRPSVPDAGIAAVRLPDVLVAGDTATAEIDVAAVGASARDSAEVQLREEGRTVGRARAALGSGSTRARVGFVPAVPQGERAVRRYTARLLGWSRDADPRDDSLSTAAVVTRAPAVVLVSESPDWDFRWLGGTLRTARATPVRSFVRAADGPWRDATSLAVVGDAAVQSAIAQASLVVAHGPGAAVARLASGARHAVWRWNTGSDAAAGDWYVTPEGPGSPVADALSGVPADSLPPLTAVRESAGDSAQWTAIPARLGRRGAARPAVAGGEAGGKRWVAIRATGLWRWASKGGVSGEAYRALVLGLTDWLLQRGPSAEPSVEALRDSLARAVAEFLPRRPSLRAQPGEPATAAVEHVPLQQRPWVFGLVLMALTLEWIVRRRRGMR